MHFMSALSERLVWARQSAGFETASAAAEALGVEVPTYIGHENGHRGFKGRAEDYARKFKVDLAWLLTGRGKPRNGNVKAIHAEGYVGAGAEILPFDDHNIGPDLDPVDLPPGLPDDAVLVIVRGDSMYPRYFDDERLFYVRRDDNPATHVGRECVVKLQDGRMFVKILRRGPDEGYFNLESWNAPLIEDVAVEWAAPVLARVNRSGK
jgi:phage repressor protein C with HTH and peptisase S24 domain